MKDRYLRVFDDVFSIVMVAASVIGIFKAIGYLWS